MDAQGVLVISFDASDPQKFQTRLNQVKGVFDGDESVSVYGMMHEPAKDILAYIAKSKAEQAKNKGK